MLKISKLADYAVVIMNFLAIKPDQVFSAAEIAKELHFSVPTVSKVLKMLLEVDLLSSSRGSAGGYQLSRSAHEIILLDIIAAIDGHPALTECSQDQTLCKQEGVCAVKHNMQALNSIIIQLLQNITLKDMAMPLDSRAISLNKDSVALDARNSAKNTP